MKAAASAVLIFLIVGGLQPAESPHPRGYVAYRTTSSIRVDGKLDDGPWKNAQWTDAFVDIEDDVRPTPRHATRVKMLWDQIHFYIGAELVEPNLWATLKDHDSVIFRDNDFEVFIDPNGDNHEYYELEINALGTTWDLLLPKPYKDDGKAVNGWEIAGMKSAVHLDGTLNNPSDTDKAWTVELALPWAALGELARRPAPPRDGDQWRVNFSRVEWQLTSESGRYQKVPKTNENNWVWSPQWVVDMHRPEKWGYVQFSTAAQGTAAFVPDASWAIREALHSIYYAQREFRKKQGRWATTFGELGIDTASLVDARLQVAGDQFEVSAGNGAAADRWHIRQDSLIWKQ